MSLSLQQPGASSRHSRPSDAPTVRRTCLGLYASTTTQYTRSRVVVAPKRFVQGGPVPTAAWRLRSRYPSSTFPGKATIYVEVREAEHIRFPATLLGSKRYSAIYQVSTSL